MKAGSRGQSCGWADGWIAGLQGGRPQTLATSEIEGGETYQAALPDRRRSLAGRQVATFVQIVN